MHGIEKKKTHQKIIESQDVQHNHYNKKLHTHDRHTKRG